MQTQLVERLEDTVKDRIRDIRQSLQSKTGIMQPNLRHKKGQNRPKIQKPLTLNRNPTNAPSNNESPHDLLHNNLNQIPIPQHNNGLLSK